MEQNLEYQKELTERLRVASQLYYAGKDSEFNDTEFDLKMHELAQLEKESGVIFPNSPTQYVGSDVQKEFKKVKHTIPMLTIDNVYDDDGLLKWVDKYKNIYKPLLNASVKYDGVSCELHYKGGKLMTASTRGDKNVGDDITANVKTIKSVPQTIEEFIEKPDYEFDVRGEILMPKSVLAKLNKERKQNGEPLFANTRNACSGSVKQLDPKVTASRNLIFRAWDLLCPRDEMLTMTMKYEALEKMGFIYEEGTFPRCFGMGDDITVNVQKFHDELKALNLDYDFDGIVLKLEDCGEQYEIGTKDTRAIEWGIARKWNEDYEARTTLKAVEWQVGKTGVLTPVGILEPVECAGVIVTNVTLNNWEYIQKFNLYNGDYVTITRSGGVIPQLIGAAHNIADEPQPVKLPERCPECGGELEFDGKLLKCTNDKCPAKEIGKILYFCSKEGCNIMSVGESVVEDLFEKRIVRDILDIIGFAEHPDWFIDYATNLLDVGYGEKKIKKIADEFVKAKDTPFEKLLAALSIPGVAKVTARNIANHFGHMDNFMRATQDELAEIDGIGEVMSKDIYEWTHGWYGATLLQSLITGRWHCCVETPTDTGDKALSGLTVCFTGKSERFSGDDVEKFLEENGAKCTHSVSKKMDYLIIGEKPGGSKVSKAQEMGIKIITENDFYRKFEL